MGINIVNGFNTSAIANLEIKEKDYQQYYISYKDAEKIDKNKDGKIDASEFLAHGMNISSVFTVFKKLAGNINAYSANKESKVVDADTAKEIFNPNKTNKQKQTSYHTNPNQTATKNTGKQNFKGNKLNMWG